MTINFTNKTIELTTAEMKKAAKSKDKFARLTMKDIAAHVEKYGSDNQKTSWLIKLTDKPFEVFIRNILFCVSVCFKLSDLFHGIFLQNVI